MCLLFAWAYLAEGATWDPNSLPDASFSWLISRTRPGPQLIKVNANGAFVVKENFKLGGDEVRFKTLNKTVPLLDGFAVLINAPQVTLNSLDPHLGKFGYQPTQLAILDANFNQTNVIKVGSGEMTMATNWKVTKNRSSMPVLPPGRMVPELRILFCFLQSEIITLSKKYLDFDVETYRITPTMEGGVALAAWVRPTDNIRDLLFMKFDENLELITSRGN